MRGLIARLTGRSDAAGLLGPTRGALDLAARERVLATARDAHTGVLLVATTVRLAAVNDVQPMGEPSSVAPALTLSRPWHEVDAGSWEPQTETISVTWVDGGRAAQWTLVDTGPRFSQVFYERVASSVLIDAPLEIPEGDGHRTVGRVALRRDLGTGRIVTQTVWARSARRNDPALQDYAARVLADLAEQAGLT